MTADKNANHYASPVAIYGETAGDVNVNHFAWAPETVGQHDRIAFSVNAFSAGGTAAAKGDIVVVEYDPATAEIVGSPHVVYEAAASGNPGMAIWVTWK